MMVKIERNRLEGEDQVSSIRTLRMYVHTYLAFDAGNAGVWHWVFSIWWHKYRSVFVIYWMPRKIGWCLCRLVSLNGKHLLWSNTGMTDRAWFDISKET